MIGQTVSHYRILEPLGEGGMGSVYLAEDTHLGRRVAVKFPSLDSDTHDYRARFLREARSVSELNHPGIATLFDYGETDGGRPFLVMELVRGRPLSELMLKGELTLWKAVAIVADVAAALIEAHARGVIHRDIKPSNIMIDERGQVKVLDFGLAKQLIKEQTQGSEPEAQTLLSTDTRSGVVLGTPAYLSPEQAVGGAVDGRSDLFALGTLLYETTTGRTPFTGHSFIEIAANVLHVEPPPPSKINSMIPRQLDFIVLKALSKKPNKRYQSAKEMLADLNAVKEQLEESSGQTLIKRASPSVITGHSKTLSSLSQMLQRPRIPISYILIGAVILVAGGGLALRFARPSPHAPPAEAQRWYQVGTSALRDGAYYQASKALEKAISLDDAYLLAHARLAEAFVELDYADRAKDELLRVNASDKAAQSEIDVLYLDAVTASVRRDYSKAVSLYSQLVAQASDAEKPYVLVDLGRAHDNNGDPKKAIESYLQASSRNPDYPTPFLQLGILYGRQSELAGALASLGKAEAIYQALGNLEGRAEVVFQRGALFNKLNKLVDARAQLEQALNLSRAADNKSQEIKTLLQLNSLAMDMGESNQATDYLQQALQLAQSNGLENLSARGLNDQGNNAFIKGDYAKADQYFTEALQSAQRSKALRNEARARFSLGQLRLRQYKADEAVSYLEPALAFYQQGAYRNEINACLVLLARANRQKGDYDSAYKANEQLLQHSQQLNDQSQIALSYSEMGRVRTSQERYSEALDLLNQAHAIYSSQSIPRSIGYNLHIRAEAFWRMGRYADAKTLLDQAAPIADKPGNEIKALSASIKLSAAGIALSEGRYADANAAAKQLVEVAGTDFKGVLVEAKSVMALAQSYSGGASGKQLATEAVELARQLNDPAQTATAQLALAEVLLISRDYQAASSNALEAQAVFARLGQTASEWQALAIAAQGKQGIGDKNGAREYAMRARDTLSKLEQRWGSDNYQTYLGRNDIQRFRKELDRLTSAPA
jgi:serine/threonine protein kinase/Tfp pilus assembly protein PilF